MAKRKRRIPGHIVVVAACHCAGGEPTFSVNVVKATEDEISNGEHYDRARERLQADAYEEPYVLFDEDECPEWLLKGALRLNDIKNVGDLLDDDEDSEGAKPEGPDGN
jgi:hypothetical protein